jgi:hypothetical protein
VIVFNQKKSILNPVAKQHIPYFHRHVPDIYQDGDHPPIPSITIVAPIFCTLFSPSELPMLFGEDSINSHVL